MVKKMKKQNSCNNCRFFCHHYAKDNTKYFQVYCGHCLKRQVIKDRRKKGYDGICDKWETMEIKVEERKIEIKDALLKMAKRIEEMSQILKDDNERIS